MPPIDPSMPPGPSGAANSSMMPPDPSMQMGMPPMGMPPLDPSMAPMLPPQKMYDVKIKRCIESGQLKIKVIPPEDFLIDTNATKVDDEEGRFYADRCVYTRSDAKLKWPDKKDLIDGLPVYSLGEDPGLEKQAREQRRWTYQDTQTDKSTEEIEVFECYIKVDYDGDGVAEWRQVCCGDIAAPDNILSNEEWSGPLPHNSLTPMPMPHRYRGRSLFDDVGDIQRVKSVLLRQLLDNTYLVSAPLRGADQGAIENQDMLLNPDVGGVVWTNGQPAAAIAEYVTPFIGDKILGVLEYFDMIMEKRTGVSRSTMALDSDTLQYQTAEAVNAQRSAAFTKVETCARNLAECGGLREFFTKLLKLIVQNQKSVKHIKADGDWLQMDPRGWNADMKVSINIGLGSGSRDRDLATLGGIAQKQELAIQALQSPFNPLLNVGHAFETYRKMAETAGLKNPEVYFPVIPQDKVAQIFQQMNQNQPPPPEMAKIQSAKEIKQMELQADQQRDQNRLVLDQQQTQQKAEIEKIQAEADIATQNRKTEAEMQMARERHALEMQQMNAKFQIEVASKRADLMAQLAKPQGVDEFGNPTGPDPAAIQTALQGLDQVMVNLPQMPMPAQNDQLAGVLQQLAQVMAAPTEIVRDQSGRPIGSQKRMR